MIKFEYNHNGFGRIPCADLHIRFKHRRKGREIRVRIATAPYKVKHLAAYCAVCRPKLTLISYRNDGHHGMVGTITEHAGRRRGSRLLQCNQ